MDLFLSQVNIKTPQLRSFLARRVSKELSMLSEPCYYPSLKKDYYEILRLSGVNEKDLKDFVKRFYKGTPGEKWAVTTNPIINLYIFLAFRFLSEKDHYGYSLMINYIMLYWYQNLIRKHIPYCDKGTFRYALRTLPKLHLFVREKSISGALIFLAKEISKAYQTKLLDYNFANVSNFIQISRSRIAQSIRSFQKAYFKAANEGQKYKIEEEKEDEDEKNIVRQTIDDKFYRFANDVSQRICVYRIIDSKAFEVAARVFPHTWSRNSIEKIVKELSSPKYLEGVRTVILVYLNKIKNIPLEKSCENYLDIVSRLVTVRRSSEKFSFKKIISELTTNILRALHFSQYESGKKFLLVSLFLAYYISTIVMSRLCP